MRANNISALPYAPSFFFFKPPPPFFCSHCGTFFLFESPAKFISGSVNALSGWYTGDVFVGIFQISSGTFANLEN